MEPDERQDSKLADVQTEPETTIEPTTDVVKASTELTPSTDVVKAAKMKKKNPKRVEQGKKLAEWNRANKQRQLLEDATRPEPALKQVEAELCLKAILRLKTTF